MKNLKLHFYILSAVSAILVLAPAGAVAAETMVMIQQTPLDGGSVNPGTGLHNVTDGGSMSLSAVPKPGYQFVYWIGDVSDATSPTTVAYADGPKIIIAVFERDEFEYLDPFEEIQSAPVGGLYASATDYSNQGGDGAGGKRPHKRYPTPDPEPKSDFVVPDPVPEPASIALLAAGVAMLRRKLK